MSLDYRTSRNAPHYSWATQVAGHALQHLRNRCWGDGEASGPLEEVTALEGVFSDVPSLTGVADSLG